MSTRLVASLLVAGCASQQKPPPNVETAPIDPLPPATAASATPEPAPPDAGDPHQIDLVVGRFATLPADGVKSFSVAGPNIDVRIGPDGKKLLIAGRKSGRVDLLLIHKDGSQEIFTFHVYDP